MKLFGQHKICSITVSILLLSLTIAGCGGPNGSGDTSGLGKGCTKVGVLLPDTASSARWDSKDKPLLLQDIRAALGSNTTVDYNNAESNAAEQQNQAEADLTKGDCILVVAPVNTGTAAAIVAKAKAAGVPVIAYDRLIESKDLSYYVSFDGVAVGELQGQYIAEHYKNYSQNGHTNVALINGAETDNNALLFRQGTHNKLNPLFNSGTLKNVYEKFTPGWNNATAQTEIEAALTTQQNDIQVAYVANDGMANNVIAALKAQQINGKVLVTGQDATVAGIQNILRGDQAMTVYKAIAKEAQATANIIRALSNGTDTATLTQGHTTKTSDGGNIPSILETPVSVDKTNIASTVLKDGFVTKNEICQNIPTGTDGIC